MQRSVFRQNCRYNLEASIWESLYIDVATVFGGFHLRGGGGGAQGKLPPLTPLKVDLPNVWKYAHGLVILKKNRGLHKHVYCAS